MIKIHNIETGEIIERDLNDSEVAQKAKDAAIQEAKLLAQSEIESKKAIAEAKLIALGLDADDLKALGLGQTL